MKERINTITYGFNFVVALSCKIHLRNYFELKNVFVEKSVTVSCLCFLVSTSAPLFLILVSNQTSLQITHEKSYSHILSKKWITFKLNKLTEDENFQTKKEKSF